MGSKKKDEYLDLTTDLIGGGTGLVLGAGVIEKLPVSGARTGVQAGLTTAGEFISPMVNIHAAGIVTKQLRDLRDNTGQKNKHKGGFRI